MRLPEHCHLNVVGVLHETPTMNGVYVQVRGHICGVNRVQQRAQRGALERANRVQQRLLWRAGDENLLVVLRQITLKPAHVDIVQLELL